MADYQENMPDGDLWSPTDIDPAYRFKRKKFRLNFSFISQPPIKSLAKEYVWELTHEGVLTIDTAYSHLGHFRLFEAFRKTEGYTFLLLSSADIALYKSYLATFISKRGMLLSPNSQEAGLAALKAIIRFGQQKEMYYVVPQNDIFERESITPNTSVEMPSGDLWILKETVTASKWHDKTIPFNFSFISQPLIQELVKRYVWEETSEKNLSISSAYKRLGMLDTVEEFTKLQCYTTLKLSSIDLEAYKSYLATKNKTPHSIRDRLTALRGVIRYGQQKGMYDVVPIEDIFRQEEYQDVTRSKHMPDGDKWIITDTDKNSQHYNKPFKFDFSFLSQPMIKALVKRYVWEETREGNIVLKTAQKYYDDFKTFEQFRELMGYTTLLFSNTDVEWYKAYLATRLSSDGTPLSKHTQKGRFSALKAIIRFGQRKEMYHIVPRSEIFTGKEYKLGKKLSYDFIPDDVIAQIMPALPEEKNIHLKCGIRIQQGTGQRIGDLLLLKVGCTGTHKIDRSPTTRYFQHKTRKNHTVKAPAFVIQAINELEEYTASIREHAPEEIKDCLFIYQRERTHFSKLKGDVDKISESTFRGWLRKFCSDNEIKDSDGEIYDLTSHQWRRTLGTDLLSKGIPLKTVAKFLGISEATANKYYATVKAPEMAAAFSGIVIGNVEKVNEKLLPNTDELKWFHENKHKGASMYDGYCSRPFKDNGEVCERLTNKWACYKCNRYITTPEYLEVHKGNLAEIEDELDYNVYGEHYAAHLRPIAALIRQIVDRLEALINEKE